MVMSFISSGKAIFGGFGVVVSVFACNIDLLHSSMNVVDLRLLVEEGSAKPEEHRLQEAHRLWPLGSSVAVRLLDGHLISHVL